MAVVAVVSDGILEAGIAELSDDEDELRIIDYRGHCSVNISQYGNENTNQTKGFQTPWV